MKSFSCCFTGLNCFSEETLSFDLTCSYRKYHPTISQSEISHASWLKHHDLIIRLMPHPSLFIFQQHELSGGRSFNWNHSRSVVWSNCDGTCIMRRIDSDDGVRQLPELK